MATYTYQRCGKQYETSGGWPVETICQSCWQKHYAGAGIGPSDAIHTDNHPEETDFIVEPVEEEPPKVPFKCSSCGAAGTIQRSKLPKDKSRVRIRCPKCSTATVIEIGKGVSAAEENRQARLTGTTIHQPSEPGTPHAGAVPSNATHVETKTPEPPTRLPDEKRKSTGPASMNENQKKVLIAAAVVVRGMLVYPRFTQGILDLASVADMGSFLTSIAGNSSTPVYFLRSGSGC